MPLNAKAIAAMDADTQGTKLPDSIREAFALTGRDDLACVYSSPTVSKTGMISSETGSAAPLPRHQEASVARK